jgi:hypothetical protein
MGSLGLTLWAWERSGGTTEALVAIHSAGVLHLALIGLFIASDVDGMSARHWTLGARWNLLKPGALRGFLFVLLCIGLYTAAMLAVVASRSTRGQNQPLAMAGVSAFAALYLAAPVALARLFPHHPSQTPVVVRIFALGLFMVGTGLPPLVAVVGGYDANHALLNLFNPVVGVANLAVGNTEWNAVVLLAAVAAAWTVLAVSMLRARDVRPKEPLAT